MKTAIITGASKGIGRAVAIKLSSEGIKCLLLARDLDALEQTANLCTGEVIVKKQDLTDFTTLQALDTTHTDILVHCAAPMFSYNKLHALTLDDIQTPFDVGLRAPMVLCSNILPNMMLRRWGRVILMGSLAARLGARGSAPYNMSKAAMESLARSIALEYGRYNITANTLVLSPIDGERLQSRDTEAPGSRARSLKESPSRKLPTPTQVADVVSFLCTDASAIINGSNIDVTCGLHLNTSW